MAEGLLTKFSRSRMNENYKLGLAVEVWNEG